ncbi:unnamed protein product [Angiostrongylus costaricensis]|uniref:Transmembrane protein n=1 Tax=Angiostrongylus costaricensis TaxID=334426 RepID=A0A0R3PHA6_ANGCS|nr:unnamed protein product [Angiostrongylus costaricensis]
MRERVAFVVRVSIRDLPFDADDYMNEQFFVPLHCIEISVVTMLSIGAFMADVVIDKNQSFEALFFRAVVVAPMLGAVEEFVRQDIIGGNN